MSGHWKWTALGAWGILAGGLLLSSCTSPNQLLSLVFDGVPPPGRESLLRPVVKPPRRPPYVPPAPLVKIEEIVELPAPIDWRARFQALARNAAGDVDWARALSEKSVAPKAGIAPDAKDEEPNDMDLEYVPKDQPEYKVIFPHKPHTQWLGCPNCHGGIFEMEKGKATMTMDKINGGAYCGVCHGKVASPDLSNCPACHKTM